MLKIGRNMARAWTWTGPAQWATGPSSGPWILATRLKFGTLVVLAIRKPMGMVEVGLNRMEVVRASPECHRAFFWAIWTG